MSDLNLHIAGLDHAEGIARVHVETWRSTYPGILPDQYLSELSVGQQATYWTRILQREKAPGATYVVCDQALVVGFVSLGLNRNRELAHRGEIYALYVLPDYQNQGVGRALLGQAFVSLMAGRNQSVLVWVLEHNPARFFYQHYGGELIAEAEENFAGRRLTKLAYGWSDLEAWRQSQSVS